MTVLPQLEGDLLAAHGRIAARRAHPVRGWLLRRGRVAHGGLLLAGAALVLAAGAGAAGLLVRVGSPIKRAPQPYAIVEKGAPPHVGPTPAEAAQMLRQTGQPLVRTARAYTMQPDPVGGPPWGLLVCRTTTGTICEHAGRVVDGRAGLVDAHRLLHPWQPDMSGCLGVGGIMRPLDAEGGALAWGGILSCVPRVGPRPRPGVRICSPNEIRTVMEGVLGRRGEKPDGARPVKVTFTTASGRFTEATPDGAYVYVVNDSGLGVGCVHRILPLVTYSDGSHDTPPGLLPPLNCAGRHPSASASR